MDFPAELLTKVEEALLNTRFIIPMDEEIITPETLPDELELGSPDGTGADSEVVSIKDILAEELGKEFPSDEAALKAVKDTFSYVGKVGKYRPAIEKLESKYGGEKETIKFMEEIIGGNEQKVDESKFISREQYNTDTFFAKNSNLEPHRKVIEAVRASTGKSLQEVVELPELKGLVEKASAYDKFEESKSVLKSNPRLGQASDKISQAREAAGSGNMSSARQNAVEAVMEAYEL